MSIVLLAVIAIGFPMFVVWLAFRPGKAPTVTLKPKADRDPMTAGCEMDAPTLGLPVEAETGRGRFQ